MKVTMPTDLRDVLSSSLTSSIVLNLSEKSVKFIDIVSHLSDLEELTLIIGAEGGFSESEIQLFESHNIPSASLGSHTLRTETAVAVSVALTRVHL